MYRLNNDEFRHWFYNSYFCSKNQIKYATLLEEQTLFVTHIEKTFSIFQ